MSGSETTNAGIPHTGPGETDTTLYDASGMPLDRAGRGNHGGADQVTALIREQPLAAALVCLIVGYVLGKLT
jgi:hypothetical protein